MRYKMPVRRAKGGWKYGDSATFKNKPTKEQIRAIEANKAKKNKKTNKKKKKRNPNDHKMGVPIKKDEYGTYV